MAQVIITLICDLNTFNALTYVLEEIAEFAKYTFLLHTVYIYSGNVFAPV